MSPDIEWQVGEDAEQEMIAQISTRRPSRWQKLFVLTAAALGLGLGILYSAVPEPPHRATVPPTALPASARDDETTRFTLLRDVIDREVMALADGDEAAFMALQDPTSQEWLDAQRASFEAWGRPSEQEARPGSLYFYDGIPPDTTSDQGTWIDISQYRRGRTFREVRFYRWLANRWVRVPPLPAYWSTATAEVVTPHFHITLSQTDRPLAATISQRLENIYDRLCRELACPVEVLTPTTLLQVRFSPELARWHSWIEFDPKSTELWLPSPRSTGLFDPALPLDAADPMTELMAQRLSEVLARETSGGAARWNADSNGVLFLVAATQWINQQRAYGTELNADLDVDLLRGRKLTLPRYLWDWPVRDGRRLASPQAQANSVIAYIEQTFGAARVVDFLKALRTAHSLPQAIETALPVSYVTFEQQWQRWLQARLSG